MASEAGRMEATNSGIVANGAFAPPTSSGTHEETLVEETGPGRRRITAEAKKELRDHFTGPPQYTRNQRMPMANINAELDSIIKKHKLSRDQA
jgi:hypothetical protein